MFKPALARGEIQCIGATTLDEYRNTLKRWCTGSRFQKILVDPTSPEETVEILHNIKEKYEDHHLVTYTDEAIDACVSLTSRYMSDRYLPDKAIDALDEAGSRVHITNIIVPKEIVTIEEDIERCKEHKTRAINSQKFEEAANTGFRSGCCRKVGEGETKMGRRGQNQREMVTAEEVDEVLP
jgi:ATP-dependent Clp protease ATP-binding subunit ClpC